MRARRGLSILFLVSATSLAAGESLIEIPLRLPKVVAGDWLLFEFGGETFRQTVLRVEEAESERFVHFRLDTLDESGEVIESGLTILAASQEREMCRLYLQAFAEQGFSAEKRNLAIGGKPVAAVVYKKPGERAEFWFSDEAGLLSLLLFKPGDDGEPGQTPLDFGRDAQSENDG